MPLTAVISVGDQGAPAGAWFFFLQAWLVPALSCTEGNFSNHPWQRSRLFFPGTYMYSSRTPVGTFHLGVSMPRLRHFLLRGFEWHWIVRPLPTVSQRLRMGS